MGRQFYYINIEFRESSWREQSNENKVTYEKTAKQMGKKKKKSTET